jgi:hypothetical protein
MLVHLTEADIKGDLYLFKFICAVQQVDTRKTLQITLAMAKDDFKAGLLEVGLKGMERLLIKKAEHEADEIIAGRRLRPDPHTGTIDKVWLTEQFSDEAIKNTPYSG